MRQNELALRAAPKIAISAGSKANLHEHKRCDKWCTQRRSMHRLLNLSLQLDKTYETYILKQFIKLEFAKLQSWKLSETYKFQDFCTLNAQAKTCQTLASHQTSYINDLNVSSLRPVLCYSVDDSGWQLCWQKMQLEEFVTNFISQKVRDEDCVKRFAVELSIHNLFAASTNNIYTYT